MYSFYFFLFVAFLGSFQTISTDDDDDGGLEFSPDQNYAIFASRPSKLVSYIDSDDHLNKDAVPPTHSPIGVNPIQPDYLPVVSQEPQVPQIPNGYTPVAPTNPNLITAFNVLQPVLVQYLYEHYPEYASGIIQFPLTASQQLVSHSAHYRVSFSILAPNSDSKLSTGNFTALIEKQTNHEANSINFVLNEVVFENENLLPPPQPKLGSQEDESREPLILVNDPNVISY